MTSVPPASAADATSPESRRARKRRTRKPWPVWVHLVIAVILVAILRNFVAQSFYVPSGSMIPTLEVGDRMVVSKFPTTLHRGDIVVFDGTDTFGGNPTTRFGSGIGRIVAAGARVFGIDVNERDYVKRIVGMPGDHVVCCDAQHRIVVNDKPLAEPYLVAGMAPSLIPFDVKVPAGRLWLMGDNRSNSADSRAHLGDPGGGMVPESDVVGKPLLRYWPLGRFGTLPSADQPAAVGG